MKKFTNITLTVVIIVALGLPTINVVGTTSTDELLKFSENSSTFTLQDVPQSVKLFVNHLWFQIKKTVSTPLSSYLEGSNFPDIFTSSVPPTANFSASPIYGAPPLEVQFTDESINNPSGWTWYFGDETFSNPWNQITSRANWPARLGHTSVVLPDGSIVLLGGNVDINTWYNDVWRSTDKGATWTQMTANAPWSARSGHCSVALPDGSIILMGGVDNSLTRRNDVWRSTDMGATWTEMTPSAEWSYRSDFSSVAFPDGSIVIMGGSSGGNKNDVWRSIDQGATWTLVTVNAEWSARNGHTSELLPDGSILLMGGVSSAVLNDVWRSIDQGATWSAMTLNAGWYLTTALGSVALPDGSILVVVSGISNRYVWRSTDLGATWSLITSNAQWPLRTGFTVVLLNDGSVELMGGGFEGVIRSDVWRWETAGSIDQNPLHTYSQKGIYSVLFQACNIYGCDRLTKENFITVEIPLLITSPDHATFLSGKQNIFTISATGSILPALNYTGTLPEGITFLDNGNGTATLAGSPSPGTAGTYPITFMASNGIQTDVTQSFTLTLFDPPLTEFSSLPTSGFPPLTTQFYDESLFNPTGWTWYFGDETFSDSWTQVTPSAEWSNRGHQCSVVLPDDSIVLMGGSSNSVPQNDVWRSTDHGNTWSQMTSNAAWPARFGQACVVLPDGAIILMGGEDNSFRKNDVWRSTDLGATWTQMTSNANWSARVLHSSVVLPDGSIEVLGGDAVDGNKNDVWRSIDQGATWTQLTSSASWSTRWAHSSVVLPDGSIVVMGGAGSGFKNDVWRSTDMGVTWVQLNASAGWSARWDLKSVALPNGNIVMIGGVRGIDNVYMNDVWISATNGATWTQVISNASWSARVGQNGIVLTDGSVVLIGGYDGNFKNDVWRWETASSNDQNPSHIYSDPGYYTITLQTTNPYGQDIATKQNYITVMTVPQITSIDHVTFVIRKDNTFVFTATGFPPPSLTFSGILPEGITFADNGDGTATLAGSPTQALARTYPLTITASNGIGTDVIQSFILTLSGTPVADFTGSPTTGQHPLSVQFTDQSSYDPTGWAWYFGDESFSNSWTQTTESATWPARCCSSSVVLPDGSMVLMGGSNFGGGFNDVWRSTDKGTTWTQMTASAGWSARSSHTSVVLPDGSIVLMGGYGGSEHNYYNDVWRSTDKGATWIQMTATAGWSARYKHTSVALPDGSIVLMGGMSNYFLNDVWRSTDKGATWSQMTASAAWSGRWYHTSVVLPDGSITLMGGEGYTKKSDVWRSTDKGATWTQMTAISGWSARVGPSSVVSPDGTIVLMGGNDGSLKNDVWRSTDMGATWAQITTNAGWSARYTHTSVVLPDGSVVLLSGSDGGYKNDVWIWETAGSNNQHPWHIYSTPGSYSVTLQAFNPYGFSRSSKTDYVRVNQPPTANAGPDQSVNTLNTVTLDGSGSNDPDDDIPLTYTWIQTAGTSVTLSSTTSASPTFTAPGNPATLTFSLVVTDSLGASSAADEVTITVNNQAPAANAGPDQSVDTLSTVTLDGSASSDPDGDTPLTYLWSQTAGTPVTLSSTTVGNPTFTAPSNPTTLTFSLVVTDSLGASSTADEVVITVNNQVPVANAGPDQSVSTLALVTLAGSGSDPDGDIPLTYAWTQIAGISVTLSSTTSASPTFSAPGNPTSLTFSLVVTDSLGAYSSPDSVTITVNNQSPMANAGLDQSVDTLSTVTLDGIGSGDPDGDIPLTYAWTQTSGTLVTLSSTSVANPTFTAPADPDTLTFSLVVTDSLGASSPADEVTITVNNQAPAANAGPDQSVDTLSTVTLDGSASSDPDGDTPLTYEWTQTAGTQVTLSTTTSASPTFSAPGNSAALTFSLVVTDSLGASSAADEVIITVDNQPPVANAGPDQSVDTLSTVTLDGTGSSDPDGDTPLTYAWAQTGGNAVTLSNTTSATPTFTAPGNPATLTFSLVVTDSLGASSAPDTVIITVDNQPPVANAGPDQSVNTLSTVTLDGSASSDPDSDTPLTYAWTQTAGTTVTLSSTAGTNPTLSAPGNPGSLTFSLVVTDSLGLDSAPDEVVITVNNQTPVADAGPNQSVDTLSTVTLDGSSSSDPDGDTPLTYEWAQTAGTSVTLSSTISASPTFSAPGNPTSLTFSIVVTDSLGASSTPDTVTITVNNQEPLANAGPNQSVNTLSTVTLNGSSSSDPDGDTPLTYAWTQTGGNAVTLSNTTSATPTFTAPGNPTTLNFSLVVTDSLGTSSAADEVTITVNNQSPVANAGPDQTIYYPLSDVTLDGSSSIDPDGNTPLTYAWTQIGGKTVSLSDPTSANPTFIAPDDTTLTFSLVVTDSLGLFSAEDTVVIMVSRISPSIDGKLNSSLVTFDWEDIPGVSKYKIQLSLEPDFSILIVNTTTTSSSYAFGTALTNGKTYYWRVRTMIGASWGIWSKPWSFYSKNPPSAPTLISPASGLKTNDKTPSFSWNTVDNGSYYQIQISSSNTMSPLIQNVKLPNEITTYTPSSSMTDGFYYWRVRAFDSVGVKGRWSAIWSFKVDTKPPAPPVLYKPLDNAVKSLTPTYRWLAAAGAKKYVFEYGLEQYFKTPVYSSGFLTTTYHKPPTQGPGDYYWRVRAFDAAGNESVSEEWKITISP